MVRKTKGSVRIYCIAQISFHYLGDLTLRYPEIFSGEEFWKKFVEPVRNIIGLNVVVLNKRGFITTYLLGVSMRVNIG